VRWQQTVAELGQALVNVVGDVVVAAGSIAYSGPFTPLYRASLLDQWSCNLRELGVPFTEGTDIIRTLEDPAQTRAWTIAGLPTDKVSIENGVQALSRVLACLHVCLVPLFVGRRSTDGLLAGDNCVCGSESMSGEVCRLDL
jgi:hypothetical protein